MVQLVNESARRVPAGLLPIRRSVAFTGHQPAAPTGCLQPSLQGDASTPSALAQAARTTWQEKCSAFAKGQVHFAPSLVLESSLGEPSFPSSLPRKDGELVNIAAAVNESLKMHGE